MLLNHMGLGVTEVPKTVQMFEKYFGLRQQEGADSDKMAFLYDDSGLFLTMFKVKDTIYPKVFHIGFMQENRQQVLDMHERLKADGFEPEDPREEFGRLTFYFQAPGGFTVEVDSFAQE